MEILPNPPRSEPRKLEVWSVRAVASYEDGYAAKYDLDDIRPPTDDEKASADFSIGKVFNGRAQYVKAKD